MVAGKGSIVAPKDGALRDVAREVAICLRGLGRDALRDLLFPSLRKRPAKEVPEAAVHAHRLQSSTNPLTGASRITSTTSLLLVASSTCPQALSGRSMAASGAWYGTPCGKSASPCRGRSPLRRSPRSSFPCAISKGDVFVEEQNELIVVAGRGDHLWFNPCPVHLDTKGLAAMSDAGEKATLLRR